MIVEKVTRLFVVAIESGPSTPQEQAEPDRKPARKVQVVDEAGADVP
ncbi:hypothetical protein [Nonomuraea deserti]|nr:hypothetical protein [Nonomuraea deserti]